MDDDGSVAFETISQETPFAASESSGNRLSQLPHRLEQNRFFPQVLDSMYISSGSTMRCIVQETRNASGPQLTFSEPVVISGSQVRVHCSLGVGKCPRLEPFRYQPDRARKKGNLCQGQHASPPDREQLNASSRGGAFLSRAHSEPVEVSHLPVLEPDSHRRFVTAWLPVYVTLAFPAFVAVVEDAAFRWTSVERPSQRELSFAYGPAMWSERLLGTRTPSKATVSVPRVF
ncbi:hypothetical protein HPB51_028374 [Rhipicephalus microplus]|uniref:Uncharacterized protein n=1 Tax=Rhipicephalus microplus TaxID=6941 RepID=A0A9J6CXN8_RHIMP|nr:hypothetical protein HPB51_028374 [Rhipicephalus microplus]